MYKTTNTAYIAMPAKHAKPMIISQPMNLPSIIIIHAFLYALANALCNLPEDKTHNNYDAGRNHYDDKADCAYP